MIEISIMLKNLLEFLFDQETRCYIDLAIQDLNDPYKILQVCDQVIKARHPALDKENNVLKMFSDPWNPYIQDEKPVIQNFNPDYKAFSLGSGRGRECPFVPATLNGGLLVKSEFGNFAYDPGVDFHSSIVEVMKYLGKFFIPDVDFILVSHSHFDHSAGLGDLMAISTKFFREKRSIPIFAPKDVANPVLDSDFKNVIDIYKTQHGYSTMKVEVDHFVIGQKILLVSDSQVFERIGNDNPAISSIPYSSWIESINKEDYIFVPEFARLISDIEKNGPLDTVYLTFQCGDILPGDFPKISFAYFLGKKGYAKSIVFAGWGSENVFGGKGIYPKINIVDLWAYALNRLCDAKYHVLKDLTWI